MTENNTERFKVIVIGGGQAGLSMGYYLSKSNLSFVILDASKRVGDSWRKTMGFSPSIHTGTL
jgi:putative flavoprotein involved in K+ transport